MPKLKTKSGAKKRFALTGTGKIKRKNAYKKAAFFFYQCCSQNKLLSSTFYQN